MTPAKLNIFFAFFPYGGTGGSSSEFPQIRRWFARTLLKAKADPRVGEIMDKDFSDTPITMTRNDAVCTARDAGADLLVMCDSDMWPDRELFLGDATAQPFWDVAFDLAYQRRLKGLVTVVGAPYCGPPPQECVYVFRWANWQSDHPGADLRLEMYTREEAAGRGGVEQVAALPTGLILFDMAAFTLVKPPYFYYEYTDQFQRAKASTEDVTATRDIALQGQIQLGHSPIFCAWDCWAGHVKPKVVGKPRLLTTDQVADKFKEAIAGNQRQDTKLVMVGADGMPGIAARNAVRLAGNGRAAPCAPAGEVSNPSG